MYVATGAGENLTTVGVATLNLQFGGVEAMARRDRTKKVGLPQDTAKTVNHTVGSLEQAFQKSEEWLRLAALGSQLGLWYWDEIRQELLWDAKTREMFGAPIKGKISLQANFIDMLHPDDRDRVMRTWRRAVEKGLPYSMDFRAVMSDGSIRWINGRGKGYYDKAGKPLYMVGVAFDITDRKEAEQERLELSGRLINAQEEERTHLARELHDDFSQRLALLNIELEEVAEMTRDSATDASKRVCELMKVVAEIESDLHSLSHRLHSSKLEVLGLVPSVRSLCAETAKQQGIEVEFGHSGVPKSLPPDTVLSLFRIVQEGLRNVIRHSRASRVEVRLRGDSDEISLTLLDNGAGFDLTKNRASNGIGIHSMRERARMLGGTFEVLSRPMQGTQITVTVPSGRSAR